MRLIIIGSGYVGLVSGACLAELGHHVLCIDKDPAKVKALKGCHVPIFEPGLSELIARNVAQGRLGFSNRLPALGKGVDVVMIAVGTPPQADGSADLSAIHAVAHEIATRSIDPPVIAIKSTVPVGTGDQVEALMKKVQPGKRFTVVSNPEFLREGSAIADFMAPDRIVIGTKDAAACAIMRSLYAPLDQSGTPLVCIGRRESELVKCAANAFLATKIAFINETADLCEAVGADIDEVAHGIGLDARIGSAFLQAGPGYGGSCFPKDTSALLALAQENRVNLRLVETVIASNEARKRATGRRVASAMSGNLSGRLIAVLGLTFKPNTDDMRDSPSLALIESMQRAGAQVRVFDPQGMGHARMRLRDVEFADDPYHCAEGADCLVLATHWPEFAVLEPERLAGTMRGRVLVDLRNFLDAQRFSDAGFSVHAIGRAPRKPVRRAPVYLRRTPGVGELDLVRMNGTVPPPTLPVQNGALG